MINKNHLKQTDYANVVDYWKILTFLFISKIIIVIANYWIEIWIDIVFYVKYFVSHPGEKFLTHDFENEYRTYYNILK